MILAHGHIADVEHTVLDAPVLAGQAKQLLGVGAIRRQRGDAVHRLSGGLTVQRSLTNQLVRLGEIRPIDVVRERGAAGQRTRFEATVAFGGGRGRLTLGGDEFLLPGGKRRPWRTRR